MSYNLEPVTREETLMAEAAGREVADLTPVTRKEMFLKDIANAGGGGGGGGFTPTTEQLAAMNSGITTEKVQQISTNETNISKQQDSTAQGGNGYALINGIRVYVSATAPTGDIPDGSIWIGG